MRAGNRILKPMLLTVGLYKLSCLNSIPALTRAFRLSPSVPPEVLVMSPPLPGWMASIGSLGCQEEVLSHRDANFPKGNTTFNSHLGPRVLSVTRETLIIL